MSVFESEMIAKKKKISENGKLSFLQLLVVRVMGDLHTDKQSCD